MGLWFPFLFIFLLLRCRTIGRAWRQWRLWPTACGPAAATGSRPSPRPPTAWRPTDIKEKALRAIPLERRFENDTSITFERWKTTQKWHSDYDNTGNDNWIFDWHISYPTNNLKSKHDVLMLDQIAKANYF